MRTVDIGRARDRASNDASPMDEQRRVPSPSDGPVVLVVVGDELASRPDVRRLTRALDRVGHRTRTITSPDELARDLDLRPEAVLLAASDGDDPCRGLRAFRRPTRLAHVLVFLWSDRRLPLGGGCAVAAGADDVLDDPRATEDALERIVARISRARAVHERVVYDPITQLRNRVFVVDELDAEIERLVRREGRCAFGVIVLEGMRALRRELGCVATERAIETFAFRLGAALPPAALACRFADDTFFVLVPGVGARAAEASLRAVRADLGGFAGIAHRDVGITATFCEAPCDGARWEALVSRAEQELSGEISSKVARGGAATSEHAPRRPLA